jgi:hypothetical protein
MPAGKATKDPFKHIREKIPSLQRHLEATQNRLQSGTVPAKHAGSEEAYRNWLRTEIRRTKTKIEDLTMSLPAGK